jgi:hypothetical protein
MGHELKVMQTKESVETVCSRRSLKVVKEMPATRTSIKRVKEKTRKFFRNTYQKEPGFFGLLLRIGLVVCVNATPHAF